jgi:hypothetical protein
VSRATNPTSRKAAASKGVNAQPGSTRQNLESTLAPYWFPCEFGAVERVFRQTLNVIESFDRGTCSVAFLTPPISVCLAARFWQKRAGKASFSGVCESYAENIGLSSVLNGREPNPTVGSLAGRTYTPLTRLQVHAQVDPCNAILNGLFENQLQGYAPLFVRGICKVVGELHDNVASHARGQGFSAAQVFRSGATPSRLQFAVADAGCGFLSNVARKVAGIADHGAAIDWALRSGNTTARPAHDPMRQRWAPGQPDLQADFGEEEDNHQGLGLSKLEELVTTAKGSLWILSGSSQRVMVGGRWVSCDPPPVTWQGVAIGVEIPIKPIDVATVLPVVATDETLRKELGL